MTIEVQDIVTGLIVMAIGGVCVWVWKRQLHRSNNKDSIELAKRLYAYLEGEAKINELMINGKDLGRSLFTQHKNGTPYNDFFEIQCLGLISELLVRIKPLSSELSTSGNDLKRVKNAFFDYEKSLELRASTIKRLCIDPSNNRFDAGHIRTQLVEVNLELQKKLKIAQGELAILLNGKPMNLLDRIGYFLRIRKEQRQLYRNKVDMAYRSVLQQSALGSAKR